MPELTLTDRMPGGTAGLRRAAWIRAPAGAAAAAQSMQRQDLEIVDCLLPPQVRQVGGRTFSTPRRPTRTTETECRVRGGEWVSYDRAKLETALGIWQAAAESGDAEAQTVVGEIYEKHGARLCARRELVSQGGRPGPRACAVQSRNAL